MIVFLKIRYFNSIKVRLKLNRVHGSIGGDYLFQFHKGTIKTSFTLYSNTYGAKFQFHKGTIKTNVNGSNECKICNFNSIKVRLKLDINPQINQSLSFQFHKGTIKTFSKFR